MRKIPPGSHRRLHRVKQGHPRTSIFAEWRCVPFGAVNLSRQPRILELGAVPTWVNDDINLNQR
jgi:hypothetical protein